MTTDGLALQRLLSWTSPAFPIGAFSYSGGLEAAIEEDLVSDRSTLENWCQFHLDAGAALQDGWAVYSAMRCDDEVALNRLSLALRQTRETRQELALLGDAFAKVMVTVWDLDLAPELTEGDTSYPVLFGLAARQFRISPSAAVSAFLHAWLANQVSVACRVIPLGQTDGQRIMHGFEDILTQTVDTILVSHQDATKPPLSAALVADWCSVKHETQYSRLFRS
ncbi:urease accessory protein UreF [Alphaproteobacteria bacterium]|nr:urease accessory protein UreF [Alphaproteobacteria bacterium]